MNRLNKHLKQSKSDLGKIARAIPEHYRPTFDRLWRPDMNTIKRTDLVRDISTRCDTTRTDAECAMKILVASISEYLRRGYRIQISGIGTFTPVDKPARRGRNPATGEEITISARTVVKFKPAKGLLG